MRTDRALDRSVGCQQALALAGPMISMAHASWKWDEDKGDALLFSTILYQSHIDIMMRDFVFLLFLFLDVFVWLFVAYKKAAKAASSAG